MGSHASVLPFASASAMPGFPLAPIWTSSPTHSYMKYLYKYPRSAYPYLDLMEPNRKRTRNEFGFELIDTGIFNDDR
jgi:hypothetical protein